MLEQNWLKTGRAPLDAIRTEIILEFASIVLEFSSIVLEFSSIVLELASI